jgi:hypothetical protein
MVYIYIYMYIYSIYSLVMNGRIIDNSFYMYPHHTDAKVIFAYLCLICLVHLFLSVYV